MMMEAFPLRVHSWALTLRGLLSQDLGAEVQNPTPTDCVSCDLFARLGDGALCLS